MSGSDISCIDKAQIQSDKLSHFHNARNEIHLAIESDKDNHGTQHPSETWPRIPQGSWDTPAYPKTLYVGVGLVKWIPQFFNNPG
jgi:hypothetical protein